MPTTNRWNSASLPLPTSHRQARFSELKIDRIKTFGKEGRLLDQHTVRTDRQRPTVEHQFILTAQQIDVNDGNAILCGPLA